MHTARIARASVRAGSGRGPTDAGTRWPKRRPSERTACVRHGNGFCPRNTQITGNRPRLRLHPLDTFSGLPPDALHVGLREVLVLVAIVVLETGRHFDFGERLVGEAAALRGCRVIGFSRRPALFFSAYLRVSASARLRRDANPIVGRVVMARC